MTKALKKVALGGSRVTASFCWALDKTLEDGLPPWRLLQRSPILEQRTIPQHLLDGHSETSVDAVKRGLDQLEAIE